ncbi:MAG: hypothetical protein GY815_02920 [Gammaproteobacteria bacterium]|nr:hypothetical protein [Gammaproteobacteria bacterium]
MTKLVSFEETNPTLAGQLTQTQFHNRDQHQQWLLTLEQTYLSLEGERLQKKVGVATGREAQSKGRDEPRGVPDPQTRSTTVVAGSHWALVEDDANAPESSQSKTAIVFQGFALDATPPRLPSAVSLQGHRFASMNQFSGALKTSAGPVLPQRVQGEIPELRSASLLKTEQGLHLVIRDQQPGDSRQLVERLRKIFGELDLPLVRITLNGRGAWEQASYADSPMTDTGPSVVNKIF